MSVTPGEIQFNRGSVEQNLPHTCLILSREQTGTTPYDEPVYGEYAALASDVPCRFWVIGAQGAGSAEQTGERRTVLAYEYRLKLPTYVNIDEDDVIDDITNQLNESMNSTRLQVTAIWKRSTEQVCVLKEVR